MVVGPVFAMRPPQRTTTGGAATHSATQITKQLRVQHLTFQQRSCMHGCSRTRAGGARKRGGPPASCPRAANGLRPPGGPPSRVWQAVAANCVLVMSGPLESLYGACLPGNGGGGDWEGEGWASIVDSMLRGGPSDMVAGGASHLLGGSAWATMNQKQGTPALSVSLQQQQTQQQQEQQQQQHQQQQQQLQQLQQQLQRYAPPQSGSEGEESMPFDLGGPSDKENAKLPHSSFSSSPGLGARHGSAKRHQSSRRGGRGKRRRRLRGESDSEGSEWRPDADTSDSATLHPAAAAAARAAPGAASRNRYKQHRQQQHLQRLHQQQQQQDSDDSAVSVGSLCLSSLPHALKPQKEQQTQQQPYQQQHYQQQQQQQHYPHQKSQESDPLGYSLSPFNSGGLHGGSGPSSASAATASSSSAAAAAAADARLENAALNDYDMCEVSVEWHLPELPETPDRQRGLVPVRRVFGINAGMTLFNLHRIICISLGLDEERMCALNHVWILPNNTTYGGGPLTKSRSSGGAGPGGAASSNRLKVTTDRAAEYRHSICCYLDEEERIIPRPESVLIYVLGCVQMQILSVLRNKTKQNALIWVSHPCRYSSEADAAATAAARPVTMLLSMLPLGGPPAASAALQCHTGVFSTAAASAAAIHTVADAAAARAAGFAVLAAPSVTSPLPGSKVAATVPRCVAAGSYGTAPGLEGMDSCVLQCYSESIHEFWRDTGRVRQLAIRVSRQSLQGKRCIEEGPSRIKQLLMQQHHQQHQQLRPFHQSSQQHLGLPQHKHQHALQQQQQQRLLLLDEDQAGIEDPHYHEAAPAAKNSDPQQMLLVPYGSSGCQMFGRLNAPGGPSGGPSGALSLPAGPPDAPDDATDETELLPRDLYGDAAGEAAAAQVPWDFSSPMLLQGTLQQQLLQHQQQQQQQQMLGFDALLMQPDNYFLLQQQQQQLNPFLQLEGLSPEAASLFLGQQLLQQGKHQQQQLFPLLETPKLAPRLDGFDLEEGEEGAAAATAADCSSALPAALTLQPLAEAHHGLRGAPTGARCLEAHIGGGVSPTKEAQTARTEDLSCSSFCCLQESDKEEELLLQQFQANRTATPALLRALQQLQLQPWATASAPAEGAQ
ncbi:hypothetical protein ACSSS7_002601 [Eimeria intestinalis]